MALWNGQQWNPEKNFGFVGPNSDINAEFERLFNATTPPSKAVSRRRYHGPIRRLSSESTLDEIMEDFRNNGVDFEYCPTDDETETSRPPFVYNTPNSCLQSSIFHRIPKKKRKNQKLNTKICVFCKNNNASSRTYLTHPLFDEENRVVCPVLRNFICPSCFATGDNAHTIKYCPKSGSSWSRSSSESSP